MSDRILADSTNDSAFVYYNGRQKLFSNDTAEYGKVVEILKNKNPDERKVQLLEFWNSLLAKPTEEDVNAGFTVDKSNGQVKVNGKVLDPVLGQRLIQHETEGLPYEPILNCAKRFLENPSYRVVQQGYNHIDRHHHPLSPEGFIITWKRVRDDFKDFYTGTFDNSVGQVVSMPRNEVDENPNHTCSKGLHLANYEYAKFHYQAGRGKMIECLLDPADIVAIPYNYDGKMRVCKYTVLSVCEEEDKSLVSGHQKRHGFAQDPDLESLCELHGEHRDFCPCDDEDDDDLDDDLD